ncbi:hypothetical protein B0J11DRAFT_541651 [Dendryphion nanum]|uniref:Putative zinc-finger domain-containing protein n=1 Tax=Dendryphion nanum TaxID=256645 RepID=A0A9P9D695_9PLEO|nr:hypothetical protein B0J11DRAFT_541651 [Dendryphion nanum]
MTSSHSHAFPFPLPFSPPQDPTQHPQPTPPSASSDPHHASIAQNFHLNGGLPGLSVQSFAPPPQPNQYTYWPASVPTSQPPYNTVPPPPSFLGQHGYPIPPLSFGRSFAPPIPLPSPAHVPARVASLNSTTPRKLPPSSPKPHTVMAVPDRMAEIVESEREEGELSETDGVVRLSSGGSITHDKGAPRSIPQVSRNTPLTPSTYPIQHGSEAERTYQHTHSTQPRSIPQVVTNLQQNRDLGRKFVSFLHENDVGYDVLSEEQLDLDLLSDMYRSLRLPLNNSRGEQNAAAYTSVQPTAATEAVSRNDKTTTSSNSANIQPKPLPAVRTNVVANPLAKTAPSPVDRKDYIARLQAAKAAKQATKPIPPQKPLSIAGTDIESTAQSSNPIPQGVNNALHTMDKSEEERIRKNELLKQRLAKLTAQHRMEASRSATPASSIAKIEGISNPPGKVNNVPDSSPNVSKSVNATVTQMPPFIGIPGLFMNSQADPSPPPQRLEQKTPSFPQTATTAIGRKRPVASDFDEVTTPRSGPIYTRPLGQSPHEHDSESMIIEVSEDDGSDMDLDEDNGVNEPSSGPSPPTSSRSGHQLRSLPSGDILSRPGSARPASTTLNTPPALRTQDAIAYQAEQLRKNTEILNLKLKIAEMTRKRKEKESLARALESSPAPQKVVVASAPNVTDHAQRPVSTLLSSAAPRPISVNHKPPMKELHILPNTGVDQTSQDWKRKRRAELQTKLKNLDDGLQHEQNMLNRLQKEMDELKAKSHKAQNDRQELMQELEGLGVDTEGMGDEDLRAKKVEIVQQLVNGSNPQAQTDNARVDILVSTPSGLSPTNGVKGTTALDTQVMHTENSAQPAFVVNVGTSSDMEGPVSVEVSPAKQAIDMGYQKQQSCNVEAASSSDAQPPIATVSPADNAALISNVVRLEGSEVLTPVDDGDDFYSPEPAIGQKQPATQIHALSPSEEGELEMSESSSEDEEEDYEPDEQQVCSAPIQFGSASPESQPAPLASSSMSSSDRDEEEVYEPPEVDHQKMEMSTHSSAESLASNERQRDNHIAMDISASPDRQSPTHPTSPERELVRETSLDRFAKNPIQSPSLPIEVNPSTTIIPVAEREHVDPAPDSIRFVPYDSPLKMFKSYRYHPNFTQDVSGGFLSMTYSHQIDPHKPLCRFESMGGSCTDPQCPDQHFRTMSLTGEKILVELGTANPGKTTEERQKWNDGLRSVLKELRQNNIKDPNGIAVEISKFRRQFFKDDFHVVTV